MPVSILGINHKTAPVAVREKVAFTASEIPETLHFLQHSLGLDEVVIISTCNRMEIIYCSAENKPLLSWLAQYHGIETSEIEPHCYDHQGSSAITHLMSVSCGLDSMVLGEPQILGQVKDAFAYANQSGSVGLYLNRLFQQTFRLAKQVRTETQIGKNAVSIAYAATSLAKRIFSDFNQVSVLLIGAGETIELAARHLIRQGVINIQVANRTVERAQILAHEFDLAKVKVSAHSLAALPELIVKADILISSTASPVPIIGKGIMEKAIVARKHQRMFLVDLAVPRDIEKEVAELSDVYLYTVDDMQGVIQENIKSREKAAAEAKNMVALHQEKYFSWLQSLSSISLLKKFRTHFEQIKNDEISRALGKLELQNKQNAQPEVEKIILEMANRLTRKFMHKPSESIRLAGEEKDQKVLEILSRTLGIKSSEFK